MVAARGLGTSVEGPAVVAQRGISRAQAVACRRIVWAVLLLPLLYGAAVLATDRSRVEELRSLVAGRVYIAVPASQPSPPPSAQPEAPQLGLQPPPASPTSPHPRKGVRQATALPVELCREYERAGVGAWAPPGAAAPLFDASYYPDQNASCGHCPPSDNKWVRNWCCGVCVFDGRSCEAEHPGAGTSRRVLEELLGQGLGVDRLTPCELFLRIRGRTLWFLGDSQTWHFYMAAECFLSPFAADLRRKNATDDPALREALRPNNRYPACLHLAAGTRVCFLEAKTAWVVVETVLPALRALGRDLTQDIMVWNVGLHALPTKMYVKALEVAAEHVSANRTWLPRLVWLDTAPQHFNNSLGLWRRGVDLQPCVEMPDRGSEEARQGGPHNRLAAEYIPRLAEAHLQSWGPTVPLYYAHTGEECTHYCHPGPYQLWTFLLNQVLEEHGLGNPLPSQTDRPPSTARRR